MSEIVLIHGACHRAASWRATLAALAQRGHGARAVSLVGGTLADHAAQIIADIPKGAVLVGHSAGGFAAHAAALAMPDQIAGLIYLCAFIPSAGKSVADLRRAAPEDRLGPAIRRTGARYTFDPDLARNLFYNDCADAGDLATRLTPDPLPPVQSALPDLPAGFPRAAIICDDDRAILPGYQLTMAQDIVLRAHLPCGHAPFYAAPEMLADCLIALATKLRRG